MVSQVPVDITSEIHFGKDLLFNVLRIHRNLIWHNILIILNILMKSEKMQ